MLKPSVCTSACAFVMKGTMRAEPREQLHAQARARRSQLPWVGYSGVLASLPLTDWMRRNVSEPVMLAEPVGDQPGHAGWRTEPRARSVLELARAELLLRVVRAAARRGAR